jgi:deaminated glutathione amidase
VDLRAIGNGEPGNPGGSARVARYNPEMVRVAAVQLCAFVGDVDANLAACERLADEAGSQGAEMIALPEFFPTGIGFNEQLVNAALPPDGAATDLLQRIALRHNALAGGSFLCRDADGHIRNAYLLVGPDGILGRHDKDLPTMWENSFYVGGHDDGILAAGDLTVGAAVCWELMRTQTARRLRGRVDIVMAGSGWWSVPRWPPRPVFSRLEQRSSATARRAARSLARYVGAPVVHAAHAGTLNCAMPWFPLRYQGFFEGGAMVTDAGGVVLAERRREEGEGIVVAEVTPGARPPAQELPSRFWLHKRGILPAVVWNYQRVHGRRWYRRHVSAGCRL